MEQQTHYTLVVEPFGTEFVITAVSEKAARKSLWDGLPDSMKDGCECIECVEQVAA